MANLITSYVQPNEIIKAEDMNNAYDAVIENVAKLAKSILECNHDFVIGGTVKKVANSWTVDVSPIFGVCNDAGTAFCDTESTLNVSVNPGSTTDGDKYGIIEVRGNYESFNNQQRAFNDPDTDTITYQYVDTQKKLSVEFQYSFNAAGVVVAPDRTEGWVKLAEIFVPQGANSIDDCTIFNISSDVVGGENEGWTTDKDASYNVGYISDLNARFRVQHNEDGSHKANVIKRNNLKIGVESDSLNGLVVPAAKSVTIDDVQGSTTDSLTTLIERCATKISELFADYFNKGGKYSFNGELKISDVFDSESSTLENALVVGASGDGSAYLKIGGKTVLTITSVGELRTSGYTPLNQNDIVTKKVTDAISATVEELSQSFQDFIDGFGSNFEYTNNILSRYQLEQSISIQAISTQNVETSGLQTIDNVSLEVSYLVLLKDQTDKSQNGIWEVQNGAWVRIAEYNTGTFYRYKFFTTENGKANKGKLFYCPSLLENFVSDEDELTFVESNLSVYNLANKIAMRDSSGHLKSAPAQSSNDCLIKADLLNLIYPVGSLYWSSKLTNPSTLFGGTWTRIKDCFVLAAGDTYTNGATGGSATVRLTKSNLPAHSHTCSSTDTDHVHGFDHQHDFSTGGMSGNDDKAYIYSNQHQGKPNPCASGRASAVIAGGGNSSGSSYVTTITIDFAHTHSGTTGSVWEKYGSANTGGMSANSSHSHTVNGGGNEQSSGDAHENMPPYVVKFCWERVN